MKCILGTCAGGHLHCVRGLSVFANNGFVDTVGKIVKCILDLFCNFIKDSDGNQSLWSGKDRLSCQDAPQ